MTPPSLPLLDAPLLTWACWYATLGWPVFPCQGKRPFPGTHGFHDATRNTFQLEFWWTQWPDANIGCPAGPWWWALDIDPRHGGDDTLRELERTYGALPRTMQSNTGGGGTHQLWMPPAGQWPPGEIKVGPGLDVQNDGHYIILPPSIHPDTGRQYVWESDYGPDDITPQPTPAWLAALITQPAARETHRAASLRDPDAPIPQGSRESTLMSLAGAMQRQGATYSAIRGALEAENARCVPPLDAADLDRMAHSVQRYAPAPQLRVSTTSSAPPPGWNANGTPAVQPNWRSELFSKKNGELYPNEFNITQILRYHHYWQQPERALWYDVLTGRHMIADEQITRAMLVDISHWFGGSERLPLSSLSLLEDCLHSQCETHKKDRIALWLNNLPPWDTTPRLETWLIHVAHADDDTIGYTRHIARRLLLSMVARGLRPGCQYREVVVLEGPENIGKSHIVETLASKEFCLVLSMNLEAKEAHMMLQRAWLAELADLDSMNRTEEARLKAFITMEEDTYIPKYRNESISVPRRAIFVGTTNDRSYLKSLSGNTRFLPLWLPGPVDLDALSEMRDQLFAEAKHAYHTASEGWWHMPDEVADEAGIRREERRVKNPYEVPLGAWLGERTETSWPEIAEYFLGMKTPESWKDRSLQMQIGSALRSLGFETVDKWRFDHATGKGRKWHGWQRSTIPVDDPSHLFTDT